MKFAPEFLCLESSIRETFARAKSSAGTCVQSVELELTDDEVAPISRSRVGFLVVLPHGPVRITWAAIGALWAASQGWHDLPSPEAAPEPNSNAALGNQWFERALGWIMRHELVARFNQFERI